MTRWLVTGCSTGIGREIALMAAVEGAAVVVNDLGATLKGIGQAITAAQTVVDEIKAAGLYGQIWQSFAVLTDNRTVGVMGDYRTYGFVCAIRAVSSEDAMTADWVRLPYEVLARMSNRIVNEVPGVTRVVYDITSKPPGTIEWE